LLGYVVADGTEMYSLAVYYDVKKGSSDMLHSAVREVRKRGESA
jgi:hypothetical protein